MMLRPAVCSIGVERETGLLHSLWLTHRTRISLSCLAFVLVFSLCLCRCHHGIVPLVDARVGSHIHSVWVCGNQRTQSVIQGRQCPELVVRAGSTVSRGNAYTTTPTCVPTCVATPTDQNTPVNPGVAESVSPVKGTYWLSYEELVSRPLELARRLTQSACSQNSITQSCEEIHSSKPVATQVNGVHAAITQDGAFPVPRIMDDTS